MMDISIATYNYDSKISRAEKEETEADIKGQIEFVRVSFQELDIECSFII